MIIRPLTYITAPVYELWVDLPNEYYLQGNINRSMSVNLTGMPNSSDLGYFTMIFEAKVWGSTGGAARIVIENSEHSNKQNWWYSDVYGMWDHFQFRTPPMFFATESNVSKVWTTDPDAIEDVTVTNNKGVSTWLWPENTYKPFKMVCDRSNYTCYVYIDNVYLGTVSNFSNDLLTWNMIYLYSDQGRSYEIAAVKNIKIAGFSTLDAAKNWSGT